MNISGSILLSFLLMASHHEPQFLHPVDPGTSIERSLHNSASRAPQITEVVQFSHPAGFYTEPFFLTLSSGDPEAEIIYTLDGSDPDPSNLTGETYQYKNDYPDNVGETTGQFLSGTIFSHTYTQPILIKDLSEMADRLTGISSTFYSNKSYAPTTPVEKVVVVKARLVKNNHEPGPVTTHTYFVKQEITFDLPLISISMDESLLFDYQHGIYTPGKDFDDWRTDNPQEATNGFTPANYQRDVEYPAHLEIFDGEGYTRVADQNIGLKLSGNVSLYFPQKSLRLFARSEYGPSTISYPFFPDLQHTSYKRVTLRNSGNDNGHTFFRDAAIHESVKHLNFGTQAYRPAVVFINGEYWGLHNMREHMDKNYLSYRYDADPDNIDLLEMFEEKEGDRAHYAALLDYLETHDLSESANYDYVLTQIDPDSFTDYQIAEIFSANTDWPGKNVMYWRTRTDTFDPHAPFGKDGRWRWLMKDTDFGFGLNESYRHNTLAFATSPDGPTLPNPPWSTLILRKLLDNADYKQKFVNRFADLLNTTFHPGRLIPLVQKIKAGIDQEMPRHISRWSAPRTMATWDGNVLTMIDFVTQRASHQRQHILSHLQLEAQHPLTLNVTGPERGYVRVNSIDLLPETPGVSSNPYPWTGIYFEQVPVTVQAIAYPGFRFVKWVGADSDGIDEEVTINLTDATLLTAVFVKESDPVWRFSPYNASTGVAINPVFAWNNSGETDLQVSTSPGFESLIISETHLAGSSYVPEQALEGDKEYFWRMKLTGSEDWTETWSFTTGSPSAPLTPPLLSLPQNGATALSITPSLVWSNITGAVNYEVQVSVSPDFSDAPLTEITSDGLEFRLVEPLLYETVYYWRVRALSADAESGWSDTWHFQTEKDLTVGIEMPASSVSIFPNPARQEVIVDLSWARQVKTVEVYDLFGRLIQSRPIPDDETRIILATDKFPKGVLLFFLTMENGTRSQRRITLY